MNSSELVDSISEFKEFKNIDRPTMMRVLEDVFKTLLRKKYGSDEHFDIIVNTDKGDLEIWRNRTIVEDGDLQDDLQEVSISEAKKIDGGFEVGDDCYEEITLESFGRRAILAARQTLISRILELEKDDIFKNYQDRIGEIITAEVYQIWKKEILLLDDEGNELLLPKTEQIKSDFYKKGETLRAVVKDVEMKGANPRVILSRTHESFLAKLLELEVPEIFDGLITIKKIVREPGERAKVAVESYDDRIDPVGACVGMKGSRIHGIVRELRNENIDIINFTNNTSLFIQRALSPAKISSIKISDDEKRVSVFLKPDQVSLAIGKGGLNIKLASKLTGYEIDVYRDIDEIEDDVDLDEFIDEIDAWVIDALKNIGCDTAKSVLELDRNEIVRRADLEEETVDELIRILREEFDN
ncbi:MAG: transcription termination factor NusA [Chitinophagales bacterium]|nr:transcription termination factor NusA [Chitinophagales bacterium]MCZ2393827.1 transcription termination factor NusA [Chitinophagales bacterium]